MGTAPVRRRYPARWCRYAYSIKIEALRRVGELLEASDRNKGVRVRGGTTGGPIIVPPAPDDPLTLAAMGLTKNLSSLAQKLAALPAEQADPWRRTATAAGPNGCASWTGS